MTSKVVQLKVPLKVEKVRHRQWDIEIIYKPNVGWEWVVHIPLPIVPTVPRHAHKVYKRKQDCLRIAKAFVDKQLDKKKVQPS